MREVATGGLVALSEPFRNASAAATVSGSGCHSNELLGSPTPRWSPREGFEGEAEPRAVEGGRLAEELLGEYRKEPGLPMRGTAALEFSIALEIDSLDLYLRMARASRDGAVRDVFHGLAEEEDRHLEGLGRAVRAAYRPTL
jgi:hypothetical protein